MGVYTWAYGFAFHLSLAVPAFGSFIMNKEEFVGLLAKSQDEILERVDSKLQDIYFLRSRGLHKICR